MSRMVRAVLDTSTVVSGIIGGISAEVIDLLREGVFQAIVSEEILQNMPKCFSALASPSRPGSLRIS